MPNYGVMALGKDGVIDMIGQSIGPADPSVTVSNPSLWPSSGTVFVNMSDTEQAVGTISGGVITFLARAVAPYNGLSTAQPHTGGDKIILIASWAAMQAAFMTKLDEVILGASAANITFPNLIAAIPTTFRHLKIIYAARGDKAAQYDDLVMTINNDAGNNYLIDQFFGENSATVTGGSVALSAPQSIGRVAAASSTLLLSTGAGEITLPNYGGTAFVKNLLGIFSMFTSNVSLANNDSGMRNVTWNSTAAITAIKLAPAGGNFVAGSVFSLYGLP